MNITGINRSLQNIPSVGQNTQDNYEKDIQQQITKLQEKMKSLDSNREMTPEQKMIEKQDLQEKIKDLNSELRQHQIEEQQKEAAQKQEEARHAAENNNNTENLPRAGLSSAETGVMISISATDEQIDSMRKVRTNLEGKLRIAETEEEKKSLRDKIGSVSKYMGESIRKSEEAILDYRKSEKDEDGRVKKAVKNDKKEESGIIPQGNRNNSFWIKTPENEDIKVVIH